MNALTVGLVVFAAAPVASTRSQTVESLATMLEQSYVTPATGKQYAQALRSNLKKGRYDGLDVAALARTLTGDLQAVSPDSHLRVLTADRLPPPPGTAPPPGPPPSPNGEPHLELHGPSEGAPPPPRDGKPHLRPGDDGAPPPHGPGLHRPPPLEGARWIAPGIAYLAIHAFPSDPDTVAQIDRFMSEHATAKAIIFDARMHHGGGIAEMNAMLPYLYAKPTVLVAMDVAQAVVDQHRSPIENDAGLRTVKGPPGLVRREHVIEPHPTEHRLFDAKVFYLTSLDTGSAAEHLALAFKRTHRATLVGERTAGANHFGDFESIGEGLSVFLPVGRTLDPDTGKDWEGVGVTPDVVTKPEDALDAALKLAAQ